MKDQNKAFLSKFISPSLSLDISLPTKKKNKQKKKTKQTYHKQTERIPFICWLLCVWLLGQQLFVFHELKQSVQGSLSVKEENR